MNQQIEFDLEREQPNETNEKYKMLPSEGRGGVLALKGCDLFCHIFIDIMQCTLCVGFVLTLVGMPIYFIIANNKEE